MSKLTDSQIRDTVAEMTASEAARGVAHDQQYLAARAELLAQALAGNPSARFVVATNYKRQQAARS